MNHEIKEEGNRITIRASVRTRRFAREPIEAVNTKDILAILESNGYNLDKYKVIKEGSCTNYKPGTRTSSEWVLELKQEEKEEEVVKSSKQSRSRRSRRATKSQEDKLLRNENLGGVRTQT